MSTRAPHHRTLWEEGRRPGPLVALSAALVLSLAVGLDLLVLGRLTLLFDTVFVVVCVGAALAVRPRDFFLVGVLPPLLLAATMLVLAVVTPDSVADPGDGSFQTLVSGLAHHARALVVGYALTLACLALRQLARRNSGRLRAGARSVADGSTRVGSTVPGARDDEPHEPRSAARTPPSVPRERSYR